jgi:hypothetical protein
VGLQALPWNMRDIAATQNASSLLTQELRAVSSRVRRDVVGGESKVLPRSMRLVTGRTDTACAVYRLRTRTPCLYHKGMRQGIRPLTL